MQAVGGGKRGCNKWDVKGIVVFVRVDGVEVIFKSGSFHLEKKKCEDCACNDFIVQLCSKIQRWVGEKVFPVRLTI